MTISNLMELLVLVLSIPTALYISRKSNRQVSDMDGLGEVVKKNEEKGIVVAQF